MTVIFNMPRDHAVNAYKLINNQVKQGLPLNISLVFNKYANKFATGYFENRNWVDGKQSEIKRQIYLLRRERIDILEKLQQMEENKGAIKIKYKERSRIMVWSSNPQ